jgi:hypothetical protein
MEGGAIRWAVEVPSTGSAAYTVYGITDTNRMNSIPSPKSILLLKKDSLFIKNGNNELYLLLLLLLFLLLPLGA